MSPGVLEMEGIYARGEGGIHFEDVPLLEFMYLAFTRMPGESYCR